LEKRDHIVELITSLSEEYGLINNLAGIVKKERLPVWAAFRNYV